MLELPLGVATSVPIGTPVFKDECMFTFDTPVSCVEGLDVDIISFRGYSRGHVNFTRDNYERTGHRYYLNIKKVVKPVEIKPVTKLEITDVAEDDAVDTFYRVYDVVDETYYSLDQLSGSFVHLVDSIIAATSSNRVAEINTWQHEISECPHSVALQSVANNVDIHQCSQCDLTTNLWLCLTCGNPGCGRSQFGSDIPGNSHGVAHFEESHHPVAVKLGSLSATGHYDAYCYVCNEEVKVPNIADHLKIYNINVAAASATEKSLTEMNIDQNLKWDFKLDGQHGEYPPVFGQDLTGMDNLGNSCYLNSVIQSVFSTDHYREYFSGKSFDTAVDNPATDFSSQLFKLYDGLWSGRYSVKGVDGHQPGIKPTQFKSLIGEGHPEFETQRQQDALEFLMYYLDQCDKRVGVALNKPFKFLWGSKVVCTECQHGRISDELIDTLVVPLASGNPTNLIESFEQLASPEQIEGYSCDVCNTSTTAVAAKGFSSFPQYLAVAVQRIQVENWVPVKVDTAVNLPYSLDVTNYSAPVMGGDETALAPVVPEQTDVFTPNPEALEMLMAMGCSEVRSAKALYHTGNTDVQAALNWVMDHGEDADIDQPVDFASAKPTTVDEGAIEMVAAMGFAPSLAKKALVLNNSDVSAAVEWLFAHPDDDGIINDGSKSLKDELISVADELRTCDTSGQYKIKAVVCHKGTSPHTGHYVAFIRKQVEGHEAWVLFNDEKVVLVNDDFDAVGDPADIVNNGYIYLFERV